jgi:peroxiredoxin Q/BCP
MERGMSLQDLMDESFETTAGKRTLKELLDPERPTVFVGYPMDFTPVCTKQMCNYRDNWPRLSQLHCAWWGINQADLGKHFRFKEEHQLPLELVTDPQGKLLKALGLHGLMGTKRGFTVVSPQGGVLGTSTIFPLLYTKSDDVVAFLTPLLA